VHDVIAVSLITGNITITFALQSFAATLE
jgi:hypothetical protein